MIVEKVLKFAEKAHEGQKRKYTGEPYINHPVRMMKMLREVTRDEAILCAALLHDVLEDTPVSAKEIEDFIAQYKDRDFARKVVKMVKELTDVSRPTDGNRAERKQRDKEHLAAASPEAKTVKLADIIDNTMDVGKNDLKFAQVYIPEKYDQLSVLHEGNFDLFVRAAYEVYKAMKTLKKNKRLRGRDGIV